MTAKQTHFAIAALIAALLAVTVALSTASASGPAASGLEIQSSAFADGEKFPAGEAIFTPPIDRLRGHKLAGEIVHVGRGCPGSIGGSIPEDPYLADPSGKIALIERGLCEFDQKIARAQLVGAVGVIVYNNTAVEGVLVMGGESPVTLPDGTTVEISIPGVGVARSVGQLLRDGAPPVVAQVKAKDR